MSNKSEDDFVICDSVADLLAQAPGDVFQDRDAWQKVARTFEKKLDQAQAEIATLRSQLAEARKLIEIALDNWRLDTIPREQFGPTANDWLAANRNNP